MTDKQVVKTFNTEIDNVLERKEEAHRHGQTIDTTILCQDQPGLRTRVKACSDLIHDAEKALRASSSPATVAPILSSGRSSKRYSRIGEPVAGGMGKVWKAWDRKLERFVAIKVSDQVRHRDLFVKEAKRAGALSHPHIIGIHDVFVSGDCCYIVSEWIDGCTLAELIDTVHWRDACRIVCDLADALDYAHSKGITHCDVKPGNILMTAQGHPMLADFGIALTLPEYESGKGHGRGTPDYMAPEQSHDSRLPVSPASDIYCLGRLFYEMLLVHPKKLNGWFSLFGHLRAERRIMRIPRELAELAVQAQSLEPSERPCSARELKQAILSIESANPPPQPELPLRRSWFLTFCGFAKAAVYMLGLYALYGYSSFLIPTAIRSAVANFFSSLWTEFWAAIS